MSITLFEMKKNSIRLTVQEKLNFLWKSEEFWAEK
jgi:hypothetical protein